MKGSRKGAKAQRKTVLTKWKPYPKYKDSGGKWLGEIPDHWEVIRLKWAFILFRGFDLVSDKFVDGPYPVCASNGVIGYHNQYTAMGPSITVGRSGSVGEVNFIERNFWAHNTALYVKKFFRSDPKFTFYLLKTLDLKSLSAGSAVGTLNRNYIHELPIAIPTLSEQKVVADILDRETARIDALIAKKQRQIELLQEKRTALISHAVTKGLNPKAKMKDSGIEWLGEIPEHWEVCPLKYMTVFINGAAFKPSDWQDVGVPIIRIENLNGGEEFNYYDGPMPEKYHVQKGDLLFGWSGNRGTSFGPFLWQQEGLHYLNQHIFRLIDYECDKMWLYWTLKGLIFYVEKQAHGIIGLVHVTKGKLGGIKVPVISLKEQKAIAIYLHSETQRIDSLVLKIEDSIAKLREYRTALISAAVTGKIDVRKKVTG